MENIWGLLFLLKNVSESEDDLPSACVMSPTLTLHTWSFTLDTSVLLLLCSPVDRPGVMELEVLEVQEECGMQLALCEHQPPQRDDHQLCRRASEGKTGRTLVLFNRETAAQLSPAPRDVIHIHPPW